MITDFFGRCKYILKDAFEKLKDHEKRVAMARVVEEFGYGGQSFVAKEFNTSRDTLRKGMHEIKSGINTIVNNLGYLLKIVQKTKPLKKLPETDAIFDNLKKVHDEIAEDDMVVIIP